ncbi:MAG: sortase family protein [Candidatus Gottesmanbacteria bacterium GW2011_GWB1_43_11]|uniref:Sortase family protein n=1 Tax=Candidatus Gottesmanbacteria bacterium GW2011_GWB1_43_11 TaxID=1618446 RepID=A0A0G1CN24_9BACT|nr:MAG: sortase family protein [Candidatus Gottesmanbacteria bacterium GW2011_GWA2_42_16]KKS55722.1 MAG: sortase family protein [Candidatus Gottesmanbacteria bacterium GW2011_GWA1_42_26]KKS80709.1 MAG: sortase family protein [Candidatus Gottesmanbacteria bacterium GW2011_GWC1_43_10]KKS86892.1 MAG: sortase family protein [Candidatus Gottesmanbacteria bacterium GW2011_GWB1_43_11]OGG10458.1 MAG: hypothetical protein A2699_03725 [Candidatus Gottesmanbacteria bacterium RIFCSPHIGHO2_01_FULL_43_15]OG
MTRYRYVKSHPVVVTVPIIPTTLIIFGCLILAWVSWPILNQLVYAQTFGEIVTPIVENSENQSIDKGEVADVDYTKASNWFPNFPAKKTESEITNYFLSIPKLGIVNATVIIGADDLSKSLIHYGGTGLPGKPGKAVIFGHSILPQFFDPQNYMSIFSLNYQLKEGDDIFIRFDGVDYRYKVTSRKITDPDDVSGLEQRFDDSYITLVTCFPSGTYLKRLWLTAKLAPFGKISK